MMSARTSATQTGRTTVLSVARRVLPALGKPLLFAALMWLAAAAGEIAIPGTPVPITLQTFVVMLAALMLDWCQAAGAVVLYLSAGAAGLPVFAGGASTAALFGPSAGFLIGFLPGVIVTALLRGNARLDSPIHAAITAVRFFGAALIGSVAVVYLFGFAIQSLLTHTPITVVAIASMGFVAGDIIKAAVAALATTALAKLR
ncbi:biotin biosynthesis protein BioY [Bifidobacterium goeldii]|uniref:Biotin transporter n=2 Tax=Bifidobacterium goeldii TaxID=2306975 RepID=A0A430FD96_9BIFI|nr:biotin transporter BioY [Bifidobacterium goeldii]RSX50790.1 biotin biosynthesis protein BioY [Bifidobacterium goeldii]